MKLFHKMANNLDIITKMTICLRQQGHIIGLVKLWTSQIISF